MLLCAACALMTVELAGCAKEVEVTTCDGTGKAMVAKNAAGRELADTLMSQWKRDHPDADWVEQERSVMSLGPLPTIPPCWPVTKQRGTPTANMTRGIFCYGPVKPRSWS
ncbi:MAG: hypothetical protein GQ528_03690 [Woeseiaceae bacterium]|nr:hypothetical protein [Woeseiaceae bacterium]